MVKNKNINAEAVVSTVKNEMVAEVSKPKPLAVLDNDEMDLNKIFSSELANESDVLKELFSYDNIKTKTELSHNDISIISRLELQASITGNVMLKRIIQELEILRVSKGRLGRGEFVKSFTGLEDMKQNKFTESIGKIFKDKV